MLGFYENFPVNVHLIQTYAATLSKSKLQQKLAQTILAVNRKTLSFEEISHPTVPGCDVILEWGIADASNFCFLNPQEAQKLMEAVAEEPLKVMDWFCAVRYYKNAKGKKTPLKFDYFMVRVGFGEHGAVEFQVHHERGPRYTSPEELLNFVVSRVNGSAARKILKPLESESA